MIFRLTPLIAVLSLPSPFDPVSAAERDDAEVARLVKQLGSDVFTRREEASKKLDAIGEPARAALREAAASASDAEIRQRAAQLIQSLNVKLQLLCYKGHSEPVFGVAFSPDGRRVVSSSFDGTVQLIDANTGKLIHRMDHPAALSVAVSPDGNKAISTGHGSKQSLRLWDLETGKQLKRFAEYHSGAYRAVFLPNGKHVLFGAFDDMTVRLLDVESGKETQRFAGHTGRIHGIALSTDGKKALSGSHDGTVRVWDNATGKELMRLEAHKQFVWALAVSPDGKRAITGGNDHAIKLWDLETGKEIRQMEAHAFQVHGLAFASDGRRIASANYDGNSVSLWDSESGKELHRYEGHTEEVYDVAFSANGQFLVSSGRDKTVRIWRVPGEFSAATMISGTKY